MVLITVAQQRPSPKLPSRVLREWLRIDEAAPPPDEIVKTTYRRQPRRPGRSSAMSPTPQRVGRPFPQASQWRRGERLHIPAEVRRLPGAPARQRQEQHRSHLRRAEISTLQIAILTTPNFQFPTHNLVPWEL
jgi:hypothetical protein